MSRPPQIFVFNRFMDAVNGGRKKQQMVFGRALIAPGVGETFELARRDGGGRVIFARGACSRRDDGEFFLGGPDNGYAVMGGELYDDPAWCRSFARAEGFLEWADLRDFHIKGGRETFAARVIHWERLNLFPAAVERRAA